MCKKHSQNCPCDAQVVKRIWNSQPRGWVAISLLALYTVCLDYIFCVTINLLTRAIQRFSFGFLIYYIITYMSGYFVFRVSISKAVSPSAKEQHLRVVFHISKENNAIVRHLNSQSHNLEHR